jgi:hypothetical protein
MEFAASFCWLAWWLQSARAFVRSLARFFDAAYASLACHMMANAGAVVASPIASMNADSRMPFIVYASAARMLYHFSEPM